MKRVGSIPLAMQHLSPPSSRCCWGRCLRRGVAGGRRTSPSSSSDSAETRWTENNRVELLADPRRAWEARLDLLESAESHIFISTYSWHEDDYGTRFRDALADVVRSRREDIWRLHGPVPGRRHRHEDVQPGLQRGSDRGRHRQVVQPRRRGGWRRCTTAGCTTNC